MVKGKTESGFNFTIDDSALHDWELLEYLDELDTNPQFIVRVAKKLLGDAQYNELKDHCRNDSGVVDTERMTKEVVQLLNSNSQTKN